MKKPKYIYDEVFGLGFSICYRWTLKDFEKYLKDTYSVTFDDHNPNMYGRLYDLENKTTGQRSLILWVDRNKPEHIAIQGLAHEAVHLKNKIFKIAGVSPDLDNDELEAYYVSMIVRKALET